MAPIFEHLNTLRKVKSHFCIFHKIEVFQFRLSIKQFVDSLNRVLNSTKIFVPYLFKNKELFVIK